jgi:hypothetical protein
MLLMLKLAIFIGSGRSERIDFKGRIAPLVVHPNQNLMQWKVSERPAPLGRKRRLGRFEKAPRRERPHASAKAGKYKAGKADVSLHPDSWQAGSLSFGEEGEVEVRHDSCDALRALIKEWQNGLTFKSVNFGEAYVEDKGNIVLVARTLGGQDYRLVIRRLPDWQAESDASCWTGSHDCRPYSGGPVPNRNETMMYALPPEFIQGPKGSTIPSGVWLKSANGLSNRKGEAFYFSLGSGLFKFFPVPSNRKLDAAPIVVTVREHGEFADHVVKRAPKIGDNEANQTLDVGVNAASEASPYDRFSRLRVVLREEGIRLGLTKGGQGNIEVSERVFGPFDF